MIIDELKGRIKKQTKLAYLAFMAEIQSCTFILLEEVYNKLEEK